MNDENFRALVEAIWELQPKPSTKEQQRAKQSKEIAYRHLIAFHIRERDMWKEQMERAEALGMSKEAKYSRAMMESLGRQVDIFKEMAKLDKIDL